MNQATTVSGTPASLGDLVERLKAFEGSPEAFTCELLALQCQIAGAQAGAVFRPVAQDRADVLAVQPPLESPNRLPDWLNQVVELLPQVWQASRPVYGTLPEPLGQDDEQPARHVLFMPMRAGERFQLLGAFLIAAADTGPLEAARSRLQLTAGFLALYEARLALAQRGQDVARLRSAMDVLSSVGAQGRFRGAAMALCNQVAAGAEAERVSLGFLKGRYVRVAALSHTERFSRKLKLVQDLESVMEECLDQDLEIIHPAPPESSTITRAAGDLAREHGLAHVASLPLRREGKPIAALTVERGGDRPFSAGEIETLRLAAEVCTPHLASLREYDRWFGARLAASGRRGLAAFVGPRHTWAKATAAGLLLLLLFLLLVPATDHVEATFTLQADQRRLIPAPFDGFLRGVQVEPGDLVKAGDVLATLEVAETRLKLAAAVAQREGRLRESQLALRDGKTADHQIAKAQADQAQADIDLLEYQIAQAAIRSPIDGQVLEGDLKRQLGAPVETGKVLFAVAPPRMWAEIAVPEARIGDVAVGQTGRLAAAASPGDYVSLRIERINPVAELVEERNVFKARAQLLEERPWFKPGVQGAVRLDAGRTNYAWIWTRDLVHWLRMKLWL